jgi:hypothetical protein
MILTTKPTEIYKGRDGWQAETTFSIHEHDYQIRTSKRSNGSVCCSSQRGHLQKGGGFSFAMFCDESINLHSEKCQGVESNIRRIHEIGLEKFMEIKAPEASAATYKIEVGQVVFTDWINGGDESRRAIYEILGGGSYKTVRLNGTGTDHDDHIRPYSEKFGIGVYYDEGDCISQDEVNNLLIAAHKYTTKQQTAADNAAVLAKAEREAKIEIGRKLVNIPASAKALIVGILKENTSDSQTDYFAHRTARLVYLAYSTHDKNLFPEFRKAALNCEDTAFLAGADKDAEEKQNYTGGHGYFLGEHSHYGWEIRKGGMAKPEDLYVAAADGRYFCEVVKTDEPSPDHNIDTSASVQLIKYSEKAICIHGDTKAVKDTLKALGGRFNPCLKHPDTGVRLAGWIFSAKKMDEIKHALNL